MKALTIICPVYNEQTTVPLFYRRAAAVAASLRDRYRVNLVFVDNASEDGTLNEILRLREQDSEIFLVAMSRNFGYQRSVEGGLLHAKGDLFLVIDVDCEDPPEMIPQMLALYEQGYDIVYGQRVDREEVWVMKALRKLFYRITRAISDEDFILDMAEFCLMTDEVRRAILQEVNSFPFIRASIGRIGFHRIGIPYKRQSRIAGKTHYNLLGMVKFSVVGILSSTTMPLRLAVYFFPGVWLLGAGIALYGHFAAQALPAALILQGLAFTYIGYALSVIAIYVARAYKNGLQRANHVIIQRKSILQ